MPPWQPPKKKRADRWGPLHPFRQSGSAPISNSTARAGPPPAVFSKNPVPQPPAAVPGAKRDSPPTPAAVPPPREPFGSRAAQPSEGLKGRDFGRLEFGLGVAFYFPINPQGCRGTRLRQAPPRLLHPGTTKKPEGLSPPSRRVHPATGCGRFLWPIPPRRSARP